MLLPAPLLLSQVGDLAAVELEARSGRLVLGRSGGGLTLFDMKLGKPAGTVSGLPAAPAVLSLGDRSPVSGNGTSGSLLCGAVLGSQRRGYAPAC